MCVPAAIEQASPKAQEEQKWQSSESIRQRYQMQSEAISTIFDALNFPETNSTGKR
jgi:hypothetical protein